MIGKLFQWIEDRTGYQKLLHEGLYENIPGGSRWIYVTGSMLVFAFITQAVTGIFLWMYYSPGSQNAWESVYYLQHEVTGGWLLRGVHHFMAQGMVVLLPLHLLQVVLCRAYVAPREINYWLGLVLMLITLGLGLTGYLLPWDQKGYWATKVATELASLPPGGGAIQKLVVGGSEYGHATLTRFFALHTGVLPALLVGVLVLHVAMFRKHGITAKHSEKRPDEHFWPMQVFKDTVACAALLAGAVALTIYEDAELGAPAEPTESFGAARPEWYFLFLFQLLKHSPTEFIGAIVLPGAAMAFLFALPFVAKVKFGHVVNVVVLLALLIGAGYLTYEAWDHDNYAVRHISAPTDKKAKHLHDERILASKQLQESKEDGEREYERVQELIAFFGIPRDGVAAGLQTHDPETQGPRIFRRNCASCHSYLDEHGKGISGPEPLKTESGEPSPVPNGAPNLYGFASRGWLTRLLSPDDKRGIASADFFGRSAHGQKDEEGKFKAGGMVEFVHDNLSAEKLKDGGDEALRDVVAALSAEAGLFAQQSADKKSDEEKQLDRGRVALVNKFSCTDCHKFRDSGELGTAPDLTGYGSAEWIVGMISNPQHERFYRAGNDRMPGFAASDDPLKNQLTPRELDMLARWLRGDDKDLNAKHEVKSH